MTIPFMILLAFALGLGVGAFLRAHITINHVHKHTMDRPEAPAQPEYNESVGDPQTRMYFDKQYTGGDQ
jgi:hypothetical protein